VIAFDAAAGRVSFVLETPTTPGVLAVRDPDGQERRLLDPNAAFLERRALARHERRSVQAADGQALTYWCLEPAKPRRDGAIVVQVHGGPYTNYGEAFMFEFHALAAAGYRVVYGNPRGGSSFGAAFAAAIKGAYGTVDADDVLAIVAHAATSSDGDPPVHLTGGSYGGFMTNWLVSHVGRFRSAVTQRSICNWLSFFGTSDIGPWFAGQELDGNPWEHTERLWRASPLKYAADVTTPTLVIHAEEDHRCPIEQGEQWFTALKVLGRAETRFLRFPGEGHELSRSGRPDRRVERLEAIVDWFDTHA
jgi:dipeptidyl aminopeptidase/acylaminoacyl peptidase